MNSLNEFELCYFKNKHPSPDSSENPFYFFFKNKKIATNSWK